MELIGKCLFWLRLTGLCAAFLVGVLGLFVLGYLLHAVIPILLILTSGP